jgi:hypothetical protein
MLLVNVVMACVCVMEMGFQKICEEQLIISNCELIKEILRVNIVMACVCVMEQGFQGI